MGSAHAVACRGRFLAIAALNAVSSTLARACRIVSHALSLAACLLGAGVAAAQVLLRDRVRDRLPRLTGPALLARVLVVTAERGNEAGLLRAAAIAAERATPS